MVLNQVVPAVTFNGHPHKATAICCYLYTHQKTLFLLGLVIFFLIFGEIGFDLVIFMLTKKHRFGRIISFNNQSHPTKSCFPTVVTVRSCILKGSHSSPKQGFNSYWPKGYVHGILRVGPKISDPNH